VVQEKLQRYARDVFSRTTDFGLFLAGHGLEARATTAKTAVPQGLNTYQARPRAGRGSDLFVQPDHILCDAQDPFSQRLWREDLDLVAVTEYPPSDFAQAVHAELDGG